MDSDAKEAPGNKISRMDELQYSVATLKPPRKNHWGVVVVFMALDINRGSVLGTYSWGSVGGASILLLFPMFPTMVGTMVELFCC